MKMEKTIILALAFGAGIAFAEPGRDHDDWRLIERDIANWNRMPKNVLATSENPSACILPCDADPLVVVLRRTCALMDDLAASVDLSAERGEFVHLMAEASVAQGKAARLPVFERVMDLNRRVSLKNPLLKGIGRILFAAHEPPGFNEWRDGSHMCDQYYGFHGTQNGLSRGDGLYVLDDPFSGHPVARNILEGKVIEEGPWKGQTLDGCAIISPDIDWDGSRIAFAAAKNNSSLDKWTDESCYHVFTCRTDGSGLRQLTSGPWNDFDPCWLPNGRLVFVSDRRGGYVRCSGKRPVPSFTLYSMFDDGADIVRLSHHETNEWHPSVNNAGMVAYTRWDYVDRGSGQAHHAWLTFPDGRDPRELNGNYRLSVDTSPRMEVNIRQVPDSRRYVATAAPHHGWAAGSLILIDPTVPDDGRMGSIRRITPEQPFPECEKGFGGNRYSGSYATAWPLSEKYFICAYDGDANGLYKVKERGRRYAITLLDVFGNRTRLYAHPTISCLDPMPLLARKRPPVLAHGTLAGRPANPDGTRPAPAATNELPKTAQIGLINVYNTRRPFPEGVKVTALRVWQVIPKFTPVNGVPRIGYDVLQVARQCLGTVPVEADGSAFFEAPADVPIFFQALDAEGCTVQNMRSDTYVHAGERLMCSGCHENRVAAASRPATEMPIAMRRAPSRLKPAPDGAKPFNFTRLVQPVLDAKCVSCHGEKRAAKAPDLRAGDWRRHKLGWTTSYDSLRHYVQMFGFDPASGNMSAGSNRAFHVPPYSEPCKTGAHTSALYRILKAGHHGVKLSPDERERLLVFMGSNGQYISHDHRPDDQRDGKVVEPLYE